MCPPEKLKNALLISNEILAILISIPPTFPIFDAVARTFIDLLPLKRQRWVSKGDVPPQKLEKKCIFETQFPRFGAYTFWQNFTKNTLFSIIKYWLLSCL